MNIVGLGSRLLCATGRRRPTALSGGRTAEKAAELAPLWEGAEGRRGRSALRRKGFRRGSPWLPPPRFSCQGLPPLSRRRCRGRSALRGTPLSAEGPRGPGGCGPPARRASARHARSARSGLASCRGTPVILAALRPRSSGQGAVFSRRWRHGGEERLMGVGGLDGSALRITVTDANRVGQLGSIRSP